MSEYITKEQVFKILKRNPVGTWRGAPIYSEEIKSVMNETEALPAADVTEVRHGRWLEGKSLEKCSLCGKKGFPDWNYCPNCGARMDKEYGQ